MRDYEAMIQAVSGKAIAEFTRRLLSSKPSLAAFGDGTDVLNYDNLVQRFETQQWGQRSSNPMGLGSGLSSAAAAAGGDGQLVHGVFERLKKGLAMRNASTTSSSGGGGGRVGRGSSSGSSRTEGS